MKKFLYNGTVTLIFVLFLSSGTTLLGEEKAANAFLTYMKGRSVIGFNFAPTIYSGIGNSIFRNIGSAVIKSIAEYNNGVSSSNTPNVKPKTAGYGMSFNYDFSVLSFMVISVEAGFVFGDFLFDNYRVRYDVIPWSVGVKFFTGNKAPYGFFLFPKIGGTDIKVSGNLLPKIGLGDMKSHGIYASLELGWRIQLFPKTGANWPLQVAIDISLLDVGYYFLAWANINEQSLNNQLKSFSKFSNMKLLFLPRIGFSLRF